MNVSVLVATYGEPEWQTMASTRAVPSAVAADPYEVLADHHPDGTIATSRNAAAAHATGDYLCFLDGDDELDPGYIAAMEQAIERNPGDKVLFTPAVRQIKKGRPGHSFFFPECDFRTGNWIVIGTLIRRDFFWEVGGFEEHPHGLEDWQIWAKCAKAGASVVKVKGAVYRAYWNRDSKHHQLGRDRTAYMAAYEKARASVWG